MSFYVPVARRVTVHKRRKILYVFGAQGQFQLHWQLLPEMAAARGDEVHVALPIEAPTKISSDAFEVHNLALKRGSVNPLRGLADFFRLLKLMYNLQPSVVHGFALKPVIYVGIAARLLDIPSLLTITGLGYVFSSSSVRAKTLRVIVKVLAKLAMRGRQTIVTFENRGDVESLVSRRIVSRDVTRVVTGGVDLARFESLPAPSPYNDPVIMFVGRFLREKGIYEFASAASRLKMSGVKARCVLVGSCDPENPGNVPPYILQEWKRQNLVELWGWHEDMAAVYAQATVVCLPSQYGEGAPRSLMEAAAAGRPVIAFRNAGAEMVVEDGVTGLLVAPHDTALTAALASLLCEPKLIVRMGEAARSRAQTHFARDSHLATMLSLADETQYRIGL